MSKFKGEDVDRISAIGLLPFTFNPCHSLSLWLSFGSLPRLPPQCLVFGSSPRRCLDSLRLFTLMKANLLCVGVA